MTGLIVVLSDNLWASLLLLGCIAFYKWFKEYSEADRNHPGYC